MFVPMKAAHAATFAAFSLAVAALAGCHENFAPATGCRTDADCLAPRICVEGLCTDTDAGGYDGGGGDVWVDGALDAPGPDGEIVDPPPPRTCIRLIPSEVLTISDVAVGEVREAAVRIENCGRSPIEVLGIGLDTSWPAVLGIDALPVLPQTIGGGDGLSFLVEAFGTQEGAYDGLVTVEHDAGGSLGLPVTAVVGTGPVEEACLRVEPVTDFGRFDVETDGIAMGEVPVYNCGRVPVTLSRYEIRGSGAGAFGVATSALPVIAPGDRFDVEVTFGPPAVGDWEAELVVTAGEVASSGVLFGVGYELEPPPVVCVRAEPTLIELGTTELDAPVTGESTVVNCGEVPVEFGAAEVTGDDSEIRAEEVPRRLDPGESGAIRVLAGARSAGSYSVRVRLDVVGGGAAPIVVDAVVSVEDEPSVGCLDFAPDTIDFGTLALGQPTEATATLVNCGDLPIRLNDESWTGDAGPFLVAEAPIGSVLYPGNSAPFTFRFLTDAVGDASAAYRVGDAATATALITLRGRGADVEDVCISFEGDSYLGDFEIGQGAGREYGLLNCGSSPIDVLRARLASGAGDGFTAETRPVTVDPGEEFILLIEFTAVRDGLAAASILIDLRDGRTGGPFGFTARGRIQTPESCLQVGTSLVDFGEVSVGLSTTRYVPVTNCGESSYELNWWIEGSGAFTTPLPAVPVRLDPGATIELEVNFGPRAEGTYREIMGITGGTDYGEVILRGVATTEGMACLDADTESIDMGAVVAGRTATRTVTFVNCGTEAITWRAGRISASSGGTGSDRFGVTEPTDRSLASGELTSVTVSFTATLPGLYAGTLTEEWSSAFTFTIPLRATIEAIPVGPRIRVEPESLDFGTVTTGGSSSATVRICNDGDQTLRITSSGMRDGSVTAFRLPSPPPATVAPGACGSIVVEFAPPPAPGGSVTRYENVLSIRSNDATRPEATVRLGGTGLAEGEWCLQPMEPVLDLGSLPSGETGRGVVRLINCGTVDAAISPPRITNQTGPGDARWETGAAEPPFGWSVPPGGIIGVEVIFTGFAEGSYGASLDFAFPDGNAISVPLRAQLGPNTDVRCLAAEQEWIELGDVPFGERRTQAVTIYNCGSVPIRVNRATLYNEGGGGFRLGRVTLPATLEPGLSLSVRVVFDATEFGDHWALVVFDSELGSGTVQVELHASVMDDPIPLQCLDVQPRELDFGSAQVGDFVQAYLTVYNCGEVTLDIWDLRVEGMSEGAFGWMPDASAGIPGPLPPGAAADVMVYFEPRWEGWWEDWLIVSSDYEMEPEIQVHLSGFAEDISVCPVVYAGAATDANADYSEFLEVEMGTRVYLDAGVSSIPGAEARWTTMSSPSGRAVRLVPTGTPGRVYFDATEEGTYEFLSEWQTADGCGGSSSVRVESSRSTTVGEGIRVVINWRTPGDPDEFADPGTDIDLHFARRTSTGTRWNGEQDCYYANCSVEGGGSGLPWGTSSDTDNPRLLRDETDGLGPEIIVIEAPEESARYPIGVHYWSDDGFGPSTVTLRVFRDGVQVATASRTLNSTGDFWLAAEVRDGGDTVLILDYPTYSGFPPPGVP